MQWFESKKAILEYCGKDGKDVRWLERAMKDGKVGFCEDAYYLTKDYIEDLEKENGELEGENVKLRDRIKELEGKGEEKSDLKDISKAMGEKVLAHGEINKLKEENSDLRRHLMYAWERIDHMNNCIDGMVQNYFNKHQQSMDFDAAQKKLYEIIKYSPDPNEKDERQFAVDNGLLIE